MANKVFFSSFIYHHYHLFLQFNDLISRLSLSR
jgi:hypothetical protein